MNERDLFVGCVAIVTGLIVAMGGAVGHDRMMQATLPQMLVWQFGSAAARIIVFLVGAAVVAIGFLVLRGDTGGESGARTGMNPVRYGRTVLAVEGWSHGDEPEC